ncbi:MAG: fibronectin type III domain-containing protein [Sedimentisphaerales bacterium]|nr:fibronectin type III domain-containing protein [Sedimentisphaerales bacterium]
MSLRDSIFRLLLISVVALVFPVSAFAIDPPVFDVDIVHITQTSASAYITIVNNYGEGFDWRDELGVVGGPVLEFSSWSYTGPETWAMTRPFYSTLSPETEYYYKFKGRNSSGESDWYEERFTTLTGQPTVSVQVENIQAMSAAATITIIDDGGEACQIKYEYGQVAGGMTASSGWFGSLTTGSTETFTISDLLPETEYYFRSKARNSAEEGSWSETTFTTSAEGIDAEINISPIVPNPASPGDTIIIPFSIENTGDSTHTFAIGGQIWSSEHMATLLNLTVTVEPGLINTYFASYSYTIPSDWIDGSYEVRITAWADEVDIGTYLDQDVEPFDIIEEIVPPNVSVQVGNIQSTSAAITITVVDDGGEVCQIKYEYGRVTGGMTASSGWFGSLTTGSTVNFSISDLLPETEHYFKAKGRNSAGEGSWSEITFTTLDGTVDAEINISPIAPNPAEPDDTIIIPLAIENTGDSTHTFAISGEIWNSEHMADLTNMTVTVEPGLIHTYFASYSYTIPSDWSGGPYEVRIKVWADSVGGTLLDEDVEPFDIAEVDADLNISPIEPNPASPDDTIIIPFAIENNGDLTHTFTINGEIWNSEHKATLESFQATVEPGLINSYIASYSYTIPSDWNEGTYEVHIKAWEDVVGGTLLDEEIEPFEIAEKVTLSISSTSGGTVIEPGEGTFTYPIGTEVYLEAQPDSGYHFVEWTGNYGSESNPLTIVMDHDYDITATFEAELPLIHSLTLSSTQGGQVIDPGEGTFAFSDGDAVTLQAAAGFGYYFTGWSGSINGMNNPVTILMDQDHDIKAEFIQVDVDQSIKVIVKNPDGEYISKFRYNIMGFPLSKWDEKLKIRDENDTYDVDWSNCNWITVGYDVKECEPFSYQDVVPEISIEIIKDGNTVVGPIYIPSDLPSLSPLTPLPFLPPEEEDPDTPDLPPFPVAAEGLYTIRCCTTVQIEGYSENILQYILNNGTDGKGRYEIYKIVEYELPEDGGTNYSVWKRYTYQLIYEIQTYVFAGEHDEALVCLPINEEFLEGVSVEDPMPLIEYDTGNEALTNEAMKGVVSEGLGYAFKKGVLSSASLLGSEVATVLFWCADPKTELSEEMLTTLGEYLAEEAIKSVLLKYGISTVTSAGVATFAMFGYTFATEVLPLWILEDEAIDSAVDDLSVYISSDEGNDSVYLLNRGAPIYDLHFADTFALFAWIDMDQYGVIQVLDTGEACLFEGGLGFPDIDSPKDLGIGFNVSFFGGLLEGHVKFSDIDKDDTPPEVNFILPSFIGF